LKALNDTGVRQEIIDRIAMLSPQSPRRWGRMTPNQMLCHLTDSMKGAIGEKSLGRVDNVISRTLIKWIGLKTPFPWYHGARTMPEMDQMVGGTPPVEFETDRQRLVKILIRVTESDRDFQWRTHPFFGSMSEWEWQRWAYLHADHHLRQFGV
jgi:hypothetical protein